ncbi:MAG: serine hydrolase domain-containing protein [Gemmatimonadales bacterium]
MPALAGFLLAFVVAAAGAPAIHAQTVADTAAAAPVRGIRDAAELEAYLDGVMRAYMREKKIAGATVSVVKDGALFFSKGYGFADVAKRAPVDPATTMFRIGSVSKLVNWTAVMQLVEQGKLDLDRDVNEYLDFEIPDTYPEPITLRHILSHTPGLEEDPRGLFTTDSADMRPMGEWLASHMPARVRPPGAFSAYSNWATALAGYIVERVSGQPWDDYIEQHIFNPLGMTYSTGRQPLPSRLVPFMSEGYEWKAHRYESRPFEIVTGAAPAGSISASANDMAKLMIAYLGKGTSGSVTIMSPATADLMYSRLQGHDPRLPGFAHGFYEKTSHGVRIIGHGGDTQWFHSDLALIPEDNVGIFMSTNTNTGGAISFSPFLQTVLDRFYPHETPYPVLTEGAKAGAKRYAGEYLMNRRNYSTYMAAFDLAGATVIQAEEDGSLYVPALEARLIPVDSLLFRDVVSGSLFAFREDENGVITHGFMGAGPMMALERYQGFGGVSFHRNVLIVGLVVFALILIIAAVRFVNRGGPGRAPVAPLIARGRRLAVLIALAQVLFVVVLVSIFSKGAEALFQDTPTSIKVALVLPVLGAVFTLLAAWVAVGQWREGAGTLMARVRHSAVVLLSLLFLWSLSTFNLLGWKI